MHTGETISPLKLGAIHMTVRATTRITCRKTADGKIPGWCLACWAGGVASSGMCGRKLLVFIYNARLETVAEGETDQAKLER
jgi:hypothetical protein